MYQGLKKWEGATCPNILSGWRAYGSSGYGAKVFGIRDIKRSKPSDVRTLGFRSPLPTGGGPLRLDRDSGMEMMSRSTLPLEIGFGCCETQQQQSCCCRNGRLFKRWSIRLRRPAPTLTGFTVGFNGMMGAGLIFMTVFLNEKLGTRSDHHQT